MFSRKSSFVLALAAGLLLAGCSNGPDTTTIANGGIVVNGDNVALHGTGGTEAFLDATGRLVIDGHDVAVVPSSRNCSSSTTGAPAPCASTAWPPARRARRSRSSR